MPFEKNESSPDDAGRAPNRVVIISGEHIHIISAQGETDQEVTQQLVRNTLSALLGKPAGETRSIEDPLAKPLTVAQIEEKWRRIVRRIKNPLSDSSIRKLIDEEIANRKQRGTLLEE